MSSQFRRGMGSASCVVSKRVTEFSTRRPRSTGGGRGMLSRQRWLRRGGRGVGHLALGASVRPGHCPQRQPVPGVGHHVEADCRAQSHTTYSSSALSSGGFIDEAHVSAQCPQAIQKTWLPQTDVDQGGSFHPPCPAPQGSGTPLGVIRGIRRRETFAALRTQGYRVRRRGLTVVYVPIDANGTEVAFAISRRSASAVRRNRCRRRLRAALGELERRGHVLAGAYLISVAPDAVDTSQHQLLERLDEALLHLSTRST